MEFAHTIDYQFRIISYYVLSSMPNYVFKAQKSFKRYKIKHGDLDYNIIRFYHLQWPLSFVF
jgi:hypothetical protein